MARAVRFNEYGGVEVLGVVEVEAPVAGDGEIVVRQRATSINPGEAKIRDGSLHEMFPSTFPSGEGSDVAGVVESIGPGVDAVAVGDEVIGWSDERSAHAELVRIPAAQSTPKPPEVSWAVAGSLFVAGCTAWAMVRAVGVSADDTVAVSAAAGGVGVFAVQLAAETGATVIGLASEPNHEWLRAHDVVPVRYGPGQRERILEAAPDGVDALIDLAGGGYVQLGLELGIPPTRIDTVVDFPAASEHGVKTEGNAAGASPETLAELARRVAAGTLEVPIAATYPLAEVAAAYAELAHGHTRGKIVLLP